MYTIDRESDVPLYIQIRGAIEAAMAAGQLKPGDRLPAVCTLAKEIGVTQATVRRALQDLVEAGVADAHVGRGTFICEPGGGEEEPASEVRGVSSPTASGVTVDRTKMAATRRMRSGVSKALYDIMPLAHKSGIVQMTHGIPDPALLPETFLDEVCAEVLQKGSRQLISATEPQGLRALREEISRRASTAGMEVSPDQVLITNGVSQAVTLIGELALETEMRLICETPSFLGIANAFSALGHWVETVRRDEAGPDMERLDRFQGNVVNLLYFCPYAHNPTGRNVSPERLDELARWARKSGAVIIADEIFRDLLYEPLAEASILERLGPEQTIVVSSLSKTVMTGLRLGWIISSRRRIQELTRLKKLMDSAAPTLIQAMALHILKSGRYDVLNCQMVNIYRKRMLSLQGWLEKRMPNGVRWSQPQGGFSMTLELPAGYSSVALLLLAVDRGVSFLPGPLFDIDHRYVNTIRLSCAWTDEQQIKEGVELLADAIAEFISRPPSESGLSGLGGYQ